MSLSRIKAFGIALTALFLAACNIGEGPIGGTGTTAPPPDEIILPTPIYSGGIYEGIIENISGSGSECATNGNFAGIIDEDGNAFLADNDGCTYFSTNIGAGSVQLIPSPTPQNFFPEITGNFDIYTTVGLTAEYSGAIVGGVSGTNNYCVSEIIPGLNGNAPGTGAAAGADPISHLWAQATVSNNAVIGITNDGICGELVTTGNGANQLGGFYSEQALGPLLERNLYNKDSSVSLLEDRWLTSNSDPGNGFTRITIDTNGEITASLGLCTNTVLRPLAKISGTLTTENPKTNVYTAEIDFGQDCPRTFSGKGWLSADNQTLTLIGTINFNGNEVGAPVYTLQRDNVIP